MFEIVDNKKQKAIIKVIGVGGCGGNAIDYMIEKNVMGVDFICANTDLQALQKSQASTIVQIGEMLTQGLGAGSRPDTGKQAAIDDKEKIVEAIDGFRINNNKFPKIIRCNIDNFKTFICIIIFWINFRIIFCNSKIK